MEKTLNEILYMLSDREGWRLAYPHSHSDDEATYRDTGIYTYLDASGAAFRQRESLQAESKIIYQPGLLAFVLTSFYVWRLRRFLTQRAAQPIDQQ